MLRVAQHLGDACALLRVAVDDGDTHSPSVKQIGSALFADMVE